MQDYIQMIINECPDDMISKNVTSAPTYLFKVNQDNPKLLSQNDRDTYIHMVMQLLYLSQQAHPDLWTAVSFLCGCLQEPNVDDYKKLGRVMKYLQATIDLPLILSADGSSHVQWWVDSSFAVHMDMKGHTGGTMSLRTGFIYSTLGKQKLVTWSSTECEVVRAHDVLP
jgi:hypothetical protein